MSIFKHTESTPDEVMDFIESRMDRDIEKLENKEDLDFGDLQPPLFDENAVFTKIMKRVEHRTEIISLRVFKWACVIALLFGLGYSTYYISQQDKPIFHEIYASRGEKLVVLLADGSRVWLNADSKMKYPERFTGDTRKVFLSGEAYFEVAKDASNPFVVQSGDLMVRVTGTKFNVKNYSTDSTIIVTLDEGKVAVGQYTKKNDLKNMTPGQTANYDKHTAQCNIYTNKYYQEQSFWKNNDFAFRNSKMDEVLNTLSRKYDVEFVIKNPKLQSYTYNIHCKGGDLNDVLELMGTITPVHFHKISNKLYEVN